MTPRTRRILIPLLALFGVQLWLVVGNGYWGPNSHLYCLAAALLVALIPQIHRPLWNLLRKLRRPLRCTRLCFASAIAIIEAISLYHYAVRSGRDLFPVMHDEFQFLLQTRMLAAGHLWMPAHPLVDFFDTFYVLIQPHYTAQSFPGTAFFFLPVIWFSVTPWKWAICLTALAVSLFYLVVTELVDGLAALLAVGLIAKLSMLRFVSTMVLAQAPLLILGLAAILAFVRYRRCRVSAISLGFMAGLMLITRPADAVIFGLPLAIAVLLRRKRIGLIMLGTLPPVILQLIINHGVTGHWLTTPFSLYNHRDQPRLVYGINTPADAPPPATRVIEKQEYYASLQGLLDAHHPSQFWHTFITQRLPVTLSSDLPQPMLIALLPIGLLGWRKRPWILAATLPLFFLIYTFYPLFPAHYTIITAPAAILTAVLAPRAVSLAWPGLRAGAWTALAVFVAGLLVTKTVDCYQMQAAIAFPSPLLAAVNRINIAARPSVILFRRSPNVPLDIEPVYNLDAPWPDDQPIIRAHDRGDENQKIFEYYATHGPDRAFYLFDEARPSESPEFLGMASDLAKTSDGHSSVRATSPTGTNPG